MQHDRDLTYLAWSNQQINRSGSTAQKVESLYPSAQKNCEPNFLVMISLGKALDQPGKSQVFGGWMCIAGIPFLSFFILKLFFWLETYIYKRSTCFKVLRLFWLSVYTVTRDRRFFGWRVRSKESFPGEDIVALWWAAWEAIESRLVWEIDILARISIALHEPLWFFPNIPFIARSNCAKVVLEDSLSSLKVKQQPALGLFTQTTFLGHMTMSESTTYSDVFHRTLIPKWLLVNGFSRIHVAPRITPLLKRLPPLGWVRHSIVWGQ